MVERDALGPVEVAPSTGSASSPVHVGDHPALDFLNTIAAPRGLPIEQIGSGRDLLRWLVGAGAIEPAEAERLLARWSRARLDKIAQEAMDLREWFRGVVARAKVAGSGALAPADVRRLNSVLARDATFQRVEPADEEGRLRVVTERIWRDPGELLVPVAAAMADLLCEGDFDLVDRCENPACTLWFYDRSKGHCRRWCSQAVCGNRAKVAAHRKRKRLAR